MDSPLSPAYAISWLDVEAAPARTERPEKPAPVEIPSPRPVVPIAPLQPDGPARFVTRHDKLSFTDWLSAAEGSTTQEPPVIKPTKAIVPEGASDWLRQAEEKPKPAPLAPIQPVAEKKGEVDTKSLIDTFIRQQTPVAPQKAEFFTPQQAAKRSLDDKAGIVTETLARVYAKQGNVPKAIEAYKRLALKYPEKSAYFAAPSKRARSATEQVVETSTPDRGVFPIVAISIIILVSCGLLALVVLAQNPKGGGLAAGFTGAQQIVGVQRTADFLEKGTWTLAGALMVLCLISAGLQNTSSSEMDELDTRKMAEPVPD